jgi:predicted exporter
MLFSGFTGLAQLGLFSITGLIVAAVVTRWVVPALMPVGFAATAVTAFAPGTAGLVRRAPALRTPLLIVVAIAIMTLVAQREPLWSDELASLSPVPRSEQLLDQQLRSDLGAPDVRYLVVVTAGDQEAVLQAAEAAAAGLRDAVARGLLEGYESPSTWLPSRHVQRERQGALPAAPALRANLDRALRGLPYRPGVFQPFLAEVAAARAQPLVERSSLDGTRLALKVDALLVRRERGWTAMLPLRGVSDAEGIKRALVVPSGAQAVFLDLKQESDSLYRSYRGEAVAHSLLGAAAIVVLLLAALRSPRRVFDVLAPLAAAVTVATCALVLAGHKLSIFHLVGLLLVVAIGSNYSLFFDRQAAPGADPGRTFVSLLFAAVTTVIGFGLLAFSRVPVLNAIGLTVGMGAVLALVFSAILHPRERGDSVA